MVVHGSTLVRFADIYALGVSSSTAGIVTDDSNVPQVNVHGPDEEMPRMPPPARVGTWPRPPKPSRAPRPRAIFIPRARNDYWLPEVTHYYEVIGECYVHGMMDGEAFGAKNERKIQQRIFELR